MCRLSSTHLFLASTEGEELLRICTLAALGSAVLFGLYGRSLAKGYLGVLKVWVISCGSYCIIYMFTYIYLYSLASILRFSSDCHLDTATVELRFTAFSSFICQLHSSDLFGQLDSFGLPSQTGALLLRLSSPGVVDPPLSGGD